MARTSPSLSRLLFACSGALLASCSVSVPGIGEAAYRCSSDDDCLVQSGYRCGAEGVCVAGAALPDGGKLTDPEDAGIVDAGTDAGPPDGGLLDAGPVEAGPPDAGLLDAGPRDAGPPDAGPHDAGLDDGGLLDAGADLCGNSVTDPGEACDDGNADNRDGCTTACEVARCGDGLIQPSNGESCDDGNTSSGDGCSADCDVEDERSCFGEPSVCAETDDVMILQEDDFAERMDDVEDGDFVYLRAGTYPVRRDIAVNLTIVGEPGAVVEGNANGPALKIKSGARVYLQGLTIRHDGDHDDYPLRLEGGSELIVERVHVGPSNAVGIYADDNNSNHLTVLRSRIEGNVGGGVRSGKAYRIVGNVIVGNGADDSDIGGVRLVTANGQFGFNTLVGNRATAANVAGGVHCAESATSVFASILWQNGGLGPANDHCTLGDTSTDTDPLFEQGDSYRLSPTSPLIDHVSSAPFEVPSDLDGDPRPLGAGYEPGADEVP